MSLNHPVIVFGGGQMGGALARFWSDNRIAGVHVIERDGARRADFSASAIRNYATLGEATLAKSILILAIKPQQFLNLDDATRELIKRSALVISIMAGIPLSAVQAIHPHAARIMPNLAVAVGAGMSVGFAPSLDDARRRAVQTLFAATGKLVWVADESRLHAATAISGSGPAYVFEFLDAFIAAAQARGFDEKQARILATQTLLGAATLAANSTHSASTLRTQVTSPGGTTEAALKALSGHFTPLLEQATKAAELRSEELANSPEIRP